MISSANRERLLGALRRAVKAHREHGTRLTVAEVARDAGVSRATANRDTDFLAAFKRAAAEAAAFETGRTRRSAEGHRKLVADLRRTIDDMANVIQALSVAYEKLEAEVDTLRSERSGGGVVAFPRPGRRRAEK